MTDRVVGIDVAKGSFDIAVELDPKGKYRTKAKLPNTPAGFAQLADWMAKHAPGAAVCMEATGVYHEDLATFLIKQGVTVYVVNPAQVTAYGKSELSRTKTDRTDAKLITRFALAQLRGKGLRPWVPLTPAQRKLRALVRRLDDLEGMCQMEHNRRDVADDTVRSSIDDVIGTLETQIDAVKKEISDHIDSDPDLKRDNILLTSIPGIGELTSAFLLGCAGDLRRFDNPGKLDAFVGLNPAIRQSGQWAGQSRLSKLGHALLRAKLYMPALTAARYNVAVRALVDRLAARGKTGKLAIGAAMRKLLHIAWGVIHSGQKFSAETALA